jgi:hypothetical protein
MISESLAELNKKLKELKKKQLLAHKEAAKADAEVNVLENLIKVKKERKVKAKVKGIYRDEIPTVFSDDLFMEQQIIFAIDILKTPTAHEIAQFIHLGSIGRHTLDAAYKRAQQVVIKLVKEQKAIKIGKYNSRYKLNIIDLKTADK